ncbi:MAG: COX15/CtaA family protein, partial [Phycisphaerales bacterium]|nr:COX15/CtaA family protein [Phycisphaerales bacterium]
MQQETKVNLARPLTLALGATTGMWVFAYIALLFSGQAGGEILFVLSALCIPFSTRYAVSKSEGALVGAISALINLLLVGSIVGGKAPGEMAMLGIVWSLCLFVVSITLGIFGASFRKNVQNCDKNIDWKYSFFVVSSALVFLMLVTGGLVTGMEAGLAVPDWPNSYGHNMLLYPLTEMVSTENEGVFFEHAHRLTGMFVGLASLIMVVSAFRWKTTTAVRWLAVIVFLLVCTQGLLGGLRVTGHLTLSQDRSVLAPNLWIGVTHGVVGQLIFAGFIWLSVMMSPSWKNAEQSRYKKDTFWTGLLVAAMVLQLVLGALYRHMISDVDLASKATHVLYTHIAVAVLVLVFASVAGLRLVGRSNATLR